MTLIEMLQLGGMAGGLVLGTQIGYSEWGWLGAVLGAPIGAMGGLVIADVGLVVLFGIAWTYDRLHIAALRVISTSNLLDRLASDVRWEAVGRELLARNVDIQHGLPRVLAMLKSESISARMRAWDVLRAFFPEVAKRLAGYDPTAGTTERANALSKAQLS